MIFTPYFVLFAVCQLAMGKKKGLSPLLVVALVAVALPYAVRSGETAGRDFDFSEDYGDFSDEYENGTSNNMTGGSVSPDS